MSGRSVRKSVGAFLGMNKLDAFSALRISVMGRLSNSRTIASEKSVLNQCFKAINAVLCAHGH